MPELSLLSQLILYCFLVFYFLFAILFFQRQIKILKGQKVPKPDGCYDEIKKEPELYGNAVANIFFLCPAIIVSIVLIIADHRIGYYLLAILSFLLIHIYLAVTANSLKFCKPRLNLSWFVFFPLTLIISIAFIIWTIVNFDIIYKVQNVGELSLASYIILYAILAFNLFIAIAIWVWQFKIFRGGRIKNPGGEYDDWHKYHIQYGYSISDVFLTSPALIIGIVLILLDYWFGYYLFAIASSVYIWCFGYMLYELKFHKPKITITWFFTFVPYIIISLLYVIWSIVNFDIIY